MIKVSWWATETSYFLTFVYIDLVENSPMSLKELCEAHERAIKTKTDVTDEVQETTNKLKQIIDRLIQPEMENREHETNGTFYYNQSHNI